MAKPLAEYGFFLLYPDEPTVEILAKAVLPCTPVDPKFHLSVLVLELKAQPFDLKTSAIAMPEPLVVQVTGNALLPKRDGTMVTVLAVERKPCETLKATLMKQFGIASKMDAFPGIMNFLCSSYIFFC
jgi:hypothetical protein